MKIDIFFSSLIPKFTNFLEKKECLFLLSQKTSNKKLQIKKRFFNLYLCILVSLLINNRFIPHQMLKNPIFRSLILNLKILNDASQDITPLSTDDYNRFDRL